jgi:DNA modification methylase
MSDGTLLKETPDEFADMIFTCPPYYNIEKYESVDGQLSDLKDYDSFMDMIGVCAQNCYRVAKPGSFCVWVVGDFRAGGVLYDFHGDTTRAFKTAGFDYHDIIIMENISPFALFTQYRSACKRYVPKTHEYVLVFRKPGEYIIPNYCGENLVENELKSKNADLILKKKDLDTRTKELSSKTSERNSKETEKNSLNCSSVKNKENCIKFCDSTIYL